MKRTVALFLAACLVFSMPCAAVDRSVGEIMEEYMADHALTEKNFAMGWTDLLSGETWFFNKDSFMVAGSMYKLPLAMAVYDRIESGEMSALDISRGFTVKKALTKSIVNSDNDAAQALRFALSEDNTVYRTALAAYSGYDVSALPTEYWLDNEMSAEFVLNTLKYLYANQSKYAELIDNMRAAQKDRYFKMGNEDMDIAHKYGSFEGALNDCAIVFGERPFALVVFTQDVNGAKFLLAEICAMMGEHAQRQTEALPQESVSKLIDAVAAAARQTKRVLG